MIHHDGPYIIRREPMGGKFETLLMLEFWDWLVSACLLASPTNIWHGERLPRDYWHVTLTINSRWWSTCFFWCAFRPFKISTL